MLVLTRVCVTYISLHMQTTKKQKKRRSRNTHDEIAITHLFFHLFFILTHTDVHTHWYVHKHGQTHTHIFSICVLAHIYIQAHTNTHTSTHWHTHTMTCTHNTKRAHHTHTHTHTYTTCTHVNYLKVLQTGYTHACIKISSMVKRTNSHSGHAVIFLFFLWSALHHANMVLQVHQSFTTEVSSMLKTCKAKWVLSVLAHW